MTAPLTQPHSPGDTLTGIAWHLWQHRTELALLLAAGFVYVVGHQLAGPILGAAFLAIAAAGTYATPSLRARLQVELYRSRARRRFMRAQRAVGHKSTLNRQLHHQVQQHARVLSVERVPSGDLLHVRAPKGLTVEDLETERLASHMRVRRVHVRAHPDNASHATVIVERCDPFAGRQPIPWPLRDAQRTSLWDPVPVGVNENGDPIALSLPERNILIGGLPGGGKSVAVNVLVAAAALDPTAKVWLLDGKRVELGTWAPIAEETVGPDIIEAIAILESLQAEMEARYRDLLARGLRKIRRDQDLPLHVVVCDELAFYLTQTQKLGENGKGPKASERFADLLRDLVARGRAAGIIAVVATQKPGSDVIPTALRDLFGFRLALRCTTPQASDTVLGQGWASQGHDASTIPGGSLGVGELLAEEERPVRVKGYYLTDDELTAIATRATALRLDRELDQTTAGSTVPTATP